MLCDALADNFKSRNHGKVGGYDAPVYKFYIESGRKYHKLIMETNSGSRSVHACVDPTEGEGGTQESFKAKQKKGNGNLLLIEDREWLLENADWAGW